ncbi:MAG: preprotein translocase subunit SecA [Firmicutes bacterium]|nr:preprotein translocase subunit SecA [Bacillota bacterium]
MAGLLKKIFGDPNEREVKRLWKKVEEVNALEQKMKALSDRELRGQTDTFRKRLQNGESEDELLPEAFAVVREAARRYTGMRPFDVQVMGGIVLHQGRTAEMKTGEGKTLVATMPAYLNALRGEGVHVVTVNDYLARRDSEWMGKIYRALGLSVGLIVHGLGAAERRAAYHCDITYGTNNEFGFDYLRDNMVLYKERMVKRKLHYAIVDEVDSILIDEARTPLIISSKVESRERELYQRWNRPVQSLIQKQRRLVRELMKEAQEKLAAGEREEAGELLLMARRGMPKNKSLLKILKDSQISKLVEQQKQRLSTEKRLPELDERLYFAIDEATGVVALSEQGNRELARQDPQVWKLLNFDREGQNEEDIADQSQEELQSLDRRAEPIHCFNQLVKAYTLYERDVDYVVTDDGRVVIVDEFTGRLMWGRRYSDGLHQAIEAKEGVKVQESSRTVASITFQNYFRIYEKLAGMTGTAATEEEELRNIYGMDVVVIPTNKPMIRKDLPDIIYRTEQAKFRAVVEEIASRHERGQPVLVGTISVEKSEMLSRMLKRRGLKHNVLNAVNHEREAEIIAQAGRKGALTISTNMAGRGTDIVLGGNPEFMARKKLVQEFKEGKLQSDKAVKSQGNNTEKHDEQNSVDLVELFPERCAQLLKEFKAATEKERQEVLAVGGLHVIGTERHESRRIDNQLRGRAGRQGDPGSTQFFISLEDDLMRLFGSGNIASILDKLGMEEDQPLEHPLISRAIENAQKKVEGRNFEIRKHVLEYDDVLNQQREVIYSQRRRVLEGENLKKHIQEMIESLIDRALDRYCEDKTYDQVWDLQGLVKYGERIFLPTGYLKPSELEFKERDEIREKLLDAAVRFYAAREEELGEKTIRELERVILLRTVDSKWMEHIDAMHDLRQGINLRAYGQQDPLVEYRYEAYEMFEEMINSLQEDVIRLLFRVRVAAVPDRQAVVSSTSTTAPEAGGLKAFAAKKEKTKLQPRKAEKVGRNEPCPCGSGKKYKKCCGRE